MAVLPERVRTPSMETQPGKYSDLKGEKKLKRKENSFLGKKKKI